MTESDYESSNDQAEGQETSIVMHESVANKPAKRGKETEEEFGAESEIETVEGYDESFATESTVIEADPLSEALPDAVFADLDPILFDLVKKPESDLNQKLMEVVIDNDDRVQIKDTKQNPWRWICSLLIRAADGTRWIGTGWLVGPSTLITAGHCVHIAGHGGWVSEIEVIPGRDGTNKPYQSAKCNDFRSVKGWIQSHSRNYDYGAILLPPGYAFGTRLGYFGIADTTTTTIQGIKVNLSGYPGDKPPGTQWFHARTIDRANPDTFEYNIDTAGGQSGSPVWRKMGDKRIAYGIHTMGSLKGNGATRITTPVYENIKKWANIQPVIVPRLGVPRMLH